MKGSEPGQAGGEPLAVAPGREGRGGSHRSPGGAPLCSTSPQHPRQEPGGATQGDSSEDALPEAGAQGGRGRGCIQPGSGHLAAEVGQPLANTRDVLERGREAEAAARGSLGLAGPWAGCGPSTHLPLQRHLVTLQVLAAGALLQQLCPQLVDLGRGGRGGLSPIARTPRVAASWGPRPHSTQPQQFPVVTEHRNPSERILVPSPVGYCPPSERRSRLPPSRHAWLGDEDCNFLLEGLTGWTGIRGPGCALSSAWHLQALQRSHARGRNGFDALMNQTQGPHGPVAGCPELNTRLCVILRLRERTSVQRVA